MAQGKNSKSAPAPEPESLQTRAPNPRNPNRLAEDDRARMGKSLAEFGDLSGIVFNRRTGLLVGGHQRSDIMRDGALYSDPLPEPEADGTVARGYVLHGGLRYSYREVDWEQRKADAAMLAANRFGRLGRDDPGILKDLLEEIDVGDFDMDLTGYDPRALEDLMTQAAPPGQFPSVDENVATDHECPRCGFRWSGNSGEPKAAGAAEN